MNREWQVSWWLRSADTWFDLVLMAANRRDPHEVASALKHFDDSLIEVIL